MRRAAREWFERIAGCAAFAADPVRERADHHIVPMLLPAGTVQPVVLPASAATT